MFLMVPALVEQATTPPVTPVVRIKVQDHGLPQGYRVEFSVRASIIGVYAKNLNPEDIKELTLSESIDAKNVVIRSGREESISVDLPLKVTPVEVPGYITLFRLPVTYTIFDAANQVVRSKTMGFGAATKNFYDGRIVLYASQDGITADGKPNIRVGTTVTERTPEKADANGTAPKVIYEEVVKREPGLFPAKEFDPRIGKLVEFPEFVDLSGHRWNLSDLRGKVVYLNLWFIGCPPCVKEIPSLNALFDGYRRNQDIVMLSLATDSAEAIAKFIARNPINMPLSSVPMSRIAKLAMAGGTIGFPTHLIIDRSGNLAVASRGGSNQIHQDLKISIDSVVARPYTAKKN